jgi:hypothetical protein
MIIIIIIIMSSALPHALALFQRAKDAQNHSRLIFGFGWMKCSDKGKFKLKRRLLYLAPLLAERREGVPILLRHSERRPQPVRGQPVRVLDALRLAPLLLRAAEPRRPRLRKEK